jgi:hypothetical protein
MPLSKNYIMMNIVIKNSTLAELPYIFKLAAMEGRNHGLNDPELFFQFDPDGFFIAVNENEIAGSISAVSYGNDFGFIGLHFILPQFQSTALADRLLEVALDKLTNRNIGINCYENQIDYYSSHGFKPYYKIAVYQGIADGKMPTMDNIVSPFMYSFNLMHNLEKKYFIYDRKKMMMPWLNQAKSLSLAKLENDAFSGYGLYLPSVQGFRISPLVAENPETAEHLLAALIGHLDQGSIFCIDLPEENKDAVRLAEKMNMKKITEYMRMYSQSDSNVSLKNIYSFTNYELG